jgi:SAM-dependent methyltransferase
MRTHLDLGCGLSPKNPFGCESLYGIDIRASNGNASNAIIVTANLGLEPIPFPDNYFDSVSAYDFFEHIPRVALDFATKSSRFPFIELMNEIWRVLKPNGILYSVTPAFPSEKAFRDPTHVNIITKKTYRYFTSPDLLARMYGFNGNFNLLRQAWVHPRDLYKPKNSNLAELLRDVGERLTGEQSHLIWEFEANK